MDEKKAQAKVKRWNAIAESAAKQSGRPEDSPGKIVMSFKEAADYGAGFDKKLIPYELAKGMEQTRTALGEIQPGDSVAIFIGPEGGFEEEEVKLASERGLPPLL